jgi:hypothetical protein
VITPVASVEKRNSVPVAVKSVTTFTPFEKENVVTIPAASKFEELGGIGILVVIEMDMESDVVKRLLADVKLLPVRCTLRRLR